MLLEHRFIIKPRYTFVSCGDVTKIWNLHSEVTAALQDKEVLAALVPHSMSGKQNQNNVSLKMFCYVCTCIRLF